LRSLIAEAASAEADAGASEFETAVETPAPETDVLDTRRLPEPTGTYPFLA
jgi:hypothetical protein